MSFARGYNPVQVLNLCVRAVQRFAASIFPERAFIFIFSGVSEGMDAAFSFPDGMPKA
jgi:hypothetical protein